MPFSFPPDPAEYDAIAKVVESVKAEENFDEWLCGHLVKKLRHHGQHDQKKLDAARALLGAFIQNHLDPAIVRLVTQRSVALSKENFFEPPKARRALRDNGTPASFYEPELIEELSERFIVAVYGDENTRLVQRKSVAIRNFIKWNFWVRSKYFFDAEGMKQLSEDLDNLDW